MRWRYFAVGSALYERIGGSLLRTGRSFVKFNGQLSACIHALLALGEGGVSDVETLAAYLQTNPAVTKQNLIAMRTAGLVRDGGGSGVGEWSLSRAIESISLRDVYLALGEPALFVLRNRAAAECDVERSVDRALAEAFRDAQALLVERLGTMSLTSFVGETHG